MKENIQEEKEEISEEILMQKACLYQLLQVSKTSTQAEIKRSYHALALKYHPDKNPDKPEARKHFQMLNEAYRILSDPEKRKVYDDTGNTEDMGLAQFEEAYSYFRTMFPKIEPKDILAFEVKYRGSQEELEDLIEFYKKLQGDLTHILEYIPVSRNEDISRFVTIYEDLIKNGKIEKNSKFEKTKNKVKKIKEEKAAANQKIDEELENKILAKYNKPNNNFLDMLEKKYSKKTKRSQKQFADIDEDVFQNIKKKLSKQKQNEIKQKVK